MKKKRWLVISILVSGLLALWAVHFLHTGTSIKLGNGQRLRFVWVPALKGWCGKYEVTNGEYRRFKPSHDSKEYNGYSLNGDRQPAVEVSWNDAQEFILWIQASYKLPTGYRLKLPSKEEWMAVAQCGDEREYPWGPGWPPPNDWNYHGNEGAMDVEKINEHQDGFPVSSPVENSGRNDLGVFGIGGNVWEWTAERYKTGSYVMRGAFWGDTNPKWLRCDRMLVPSHDRNYFGGFRLYLIPEEKLSTQ